MRSRINHLHPRPPHLTPHIGLDLGWSMLEDDMGTNVFIRNSPLTYNALECHTLSFVSSSAKVNLHLRRADDREVLNAGVVGLALVPPLLEGEQNHDADREKGKRDGKAACLPAQPSAWGFEKPCQRLLSSEGTSQRGESTPSTGRRPSSRASDDC